MHLYCAPPRRRGLIRLLCAAGPTDGGVGTSALCIRLFVSSSASLRSVAGSSYFDGSTDCAGGGTCELVGVGTVYGCCGAAFCDVVVGASGRDEVDVGYAQRAAGIACQSTCLSFPPAEVSPAADVDGDADSDIAPGGAKEGGALILLPVPPAAEPEEPR